MAAETDEQSTAEQESMASTTDQQQYSDEGHQDTTEGVDLLDGEIVLENRHPAYVNWWKSILIGALFALTALSAATQGSSGVILLAILTALIFAYVYYSRQVSRYVVTNQRVMKETGLISSKTGESRISDIRSISTSQGIIERISSKGSVEIDSTGTGGLIGINGVGDYNSLARTIREQQQARDK
jgi:uncharacterized membrane protein YdbT with pleckstrin-like domain